MTSAANSIPAIVESRKSDYPERMKSMQEAADRYDELQRRIPAKPQPPLAMSGVAHCELRLNLV